MIESTVSPMNPDTNSPSGFSKRKPGRPPKLRYGSGLGVQGQIPNVQSDNTDVSPHQPQFQYQGGSEPVSASLAPGNEIVAVPLLPTTENSAAPPKRGRGRPPKIHAATGHVTGSDGVGNQGVETGSGPPASNTKMMSEPIGGNGGRVKRGRGRPRRIGIGPVTAPLSGNVVRPRGRPKKSGRPNVAVNCGVGGSGLGSRRSGRPSAVDTAKLIGKRVGRPNKVGAGTAVLVTDPRQLVVYQELNTKYELLESKVKQVVNVIKPCIDGDNGNHALEMLQELEDLIGTNTNAHFPQN
ncbi:hypothetical protein L2E82_36095 [Cichorium intybus]|uniref:Uncharacterized protein n=1 Tax=Cichorium intybus TaxID=13427 RepID=A0ACB9BQQ7_CICIN|nr:hypothetical protein L2E82_36095 [Cichorium intybus]